MAVPLVLVVDDDAAIRDLIVLCLEDEGIAAIDAADGLDALMLLERHHPTVIILDILMSPMNGITFLRDMRLSGFAPVPVILCTSDLHIEEKVDVSKFAGILLKPFDLDDLYGLVRGALQLSLANAD